MRHVKWLAVLVAVLATTAFANSYFVQMATIRGGTNAKGPVCVSATVFQPGESVVWQAYVFDAVTGARVSPAEIKNRGIKVFVTLDGGKTIALAYGGHPPSAPAASQEHFWTGGWDIPADGSVGTYSWTMTVTDNAGHSDSFTPIGQDVGLNELTVAKPQG